MKLSHNPALQRFGRRLGHAGKRWAGRLLDWIVPVPSNIPVESLRDVRRVLLVRPNFRIGNTLITSPLVEALRQRFPGAQIDYLAGDTTASLLRHLPIDHVYCVSRRFIVRPWQFVAVFSRLRRNHYDVAVEAGIGSFSGGLYALLSGARFRVGCVDSADRFLNVRLPRFQVEHAYDSPVEFASRMGAPCADHPVYAVGAEERAAARRMLEGLGLLHGGEVIPFVAVFAGGHQEKRWPIGRWRELVAKLAAAGADVVLFLGPEEVRFEHTLRQELPASVRIVAPQPLRGFAALWAEARLIVTPDSGPMHLAAALQVPTIALLQTDSSLRYQPRRPEDRVLLRPTVTEAVAAITAHPAWVRKQPDRGGESDPVCRGLLASDRRHGV